MYQSDYLMRMFLALATAIRDSIVRARGGDDLEGATEMLEHAFGQATDFDGSLLLRMAPESMVAMLQTSDTDPKLMGYLSRTLLLESQYLFQMHEDDLAALRRAQAMALSDAYGLGVDDASVSDEALDEFIGTDAS